jgi:acyl-CoA thioesterase FadM
MPSDYIVFREPRGEQAEVPEDGGGSRITVEVGWIEIGRATASTSQAAIKAATNGKPAAERTGTFVAVPARSWKPMSRRVESVEKESWE